MHRLFLNGQLDAIRLCEAIRTLRTHGYFPEVDNMEINDDYSESSENAMLSLVRATKLQPTVKAFVNSTKDLEKLEDILTTDKSVKESFLYTVASILQKIQESSNEKKELTSNSSNTDNDEKVISIVQEKKEEIKKNISSKEITTELTLPLRHPTEEKERIASVAVVDEESGETEQVEPTEEESNNYEGDNAQVSGNDVQPTGDKEEEPNKTNPVTDEEETKQVPPIEELEAFAPFTSMVTPEERKWFEEFAPYMVGKARSINRVINVYNLARHVANKLVVDSNSKFRRKLMKLIILTEFWPYRTAFLMQVSVGLCCLVSFLNLHSKLMIYFLLHHRRILCNWKTSQLSSKRVRRFTIVYKVSASMKFYRKLHSVLERSKKRYLFLHCTTVLWNDYFMYRVRKKMG